MFYYLLIEYFFHLALQYDIAKESCAAGPAGQRKEAAQQYIPVQL